MKKLIATLAAIAFGAALLAAPTAALSVPGNTCNPPAGHGRSGCHRVTVDPVTPPVASVPGTPTAIARPSGPSRIKFRRKVTLTGTVSPAEAGGYVTIVRTRLVGKKWKKAGSFTVSVVDGTYTYRFKPSRKGQWRFVAKYSGTWDGAAGFAASKSAAKNVRVR